VGEAVSSLGRGDRFPEVMGVIVIASVCLGLAPESVTAILATCIYGIGWAGCQVCFDVIRAGLVDRHYDLTGQRSEAVYFSLLGFGIHLSGVLQGAAMLAVGLLFGYISGEQPGPQPGLAFRFLISVVPVISLFLSMYFARQFFKQIPPTPLPNPCNDLDWRPLRAGCRAMVNESRPEYKTPPPDSTLRWTTFHEQTDIVFLSVCFYLTKEKYMSPITSFIKRYPQGVFWGIAYVVGTGGYILSVLYPSDFWPFILWLIFLGGALVTWIADGRAAVKEYFSRIVRWRVGIHWYAIAIFVPLLMQLAAIALNLITGARISENVQLPALSQVIPVVMLIFLSIALGEEPGFRGFALPRLMAGRSAIMASLILGVLAAIWHLPLFIAGEEPLANMLNVVFGVVLIAWVFNNTRGSVLLTMILHTSVNLWVAYLQPLFTGTDAARKEIWLGVVYVAVAILLRVFVGPELGRKPEATITMPAKQPMAAD
jgi:membrane protease YdiL (CAAX protease family)